MNSLLRNLYDFLAFSLSLIFRTWYESYYTRIQTSDNSSIILIFSSIPNGGTKAIESPSVHFSFAPSKQSALRPIRIEKSPSTFRYHELGAPLTDGRQAFRLLADNFGTFFVGHDYQYYWLYLPDPDDETAFLTISACLTERTPISKDKPLSTLYNTFVRLNSLLPSHWHIFSTRSVAKYMITRRKRAVTKDGKVKRIEEVLLEGEGLAYIEKNWGRGLPRGWNRMQGFDPSPLTSANHFSQEEAASFALAGGDIGVLGLKAYLAAYRSPTAGFEWNFGVPWTLLPLGSTRRGLFRIFSSEYIKEDNFHPKAEIDLRSLTKRLLVRAETSEDVRTWLPLEYPDMSGSGKASARETFSSQVEVVAYRRPLRHVFNAEGWQVVDRRVFEDAAFKLGGNYRTKTMLKNDERLEQADPKRDFAAKHV